MPSGSQRLKESVGWQRNRGLGYHSAEHWPWDYQDSGQETQKLQHVSVFPSCFQDGTNITGEMIDDIVATEWQLDELYHLPKSKGLLPRSQGQLQADVAGQYGGVAKRLADGQVTGKTHDSEKEELSGARRSGRRPAASSRGCN